MRKSEVSNSTENKEKKVLLKTLMNKLINPITTFIAKKFEKPAVETERGREAPEKIKAKFISILMAIIPTLSGGDIDLSQQQVRPENVGLTDVDEATKCTYKLRNGELSFSVDSNGKEKWVW